MPLRKNRTFAAYLLCAGLADTGFWIYYIAQGWLVLQLTNSPFWLGVVAGCGQLPYLLFSFLGGSLADRFERRILIAVGNALLVLVAIVTALLIARGLMTIPLLSILAFAIGTVIALEHPIDRAWLYDIVAGEELGRAIALSSLEWSVARTVGPAIGGISIVAIGIASGFGAFALSLVPMIVLALLALKRHIAATRAETNDADRTEATPISLESIIVPFSLLVASFTIGISPYITLLPDISKNILHLDARGYGVLSGAAGAGAVVGAIVLTTIGNVRDKGRMIPLAMFLGAALLVAFTYARTPIAAAVLLFFMGAVDTLMYALANTYVQECAGDNERGRANGYFSLAFLGGIPIGNLIIGALAARIGSESALAITATFAALACAVFWLGAPRAREAA